jgi:MFS family permease
VAFSSKPAAHAMDGDRVSARSTGGSAVALPTVGDGNAPVSRSLQPNDVGFGSVRYRYYVLILLLFAYILNFIDRSILAIVQEPLKAEFALSDLQLGLLGGPAFAILYTAFGVPIARLAERKNRVRIVAIAAAVWSAMTALCGLATGYLGLFLARIGVSLGEAGCTPPAQSVIADYFPVNRRATALSIYALGVPLGSLTAYVLGGFLAERFGWRMTFLVLGLPGLLVALLLWLSVKEPPRTGLSAAPAPSDFLGAVGSLWRKPTFRHLLLGYTIANFVAYGVGQYVASFMVRAHGLNLVQAGQVTGLAFSLVGAISTVTAGTITDRLSGRYPTIALWGPALGLFAAVPVFAAAYSQHSLTFAIPLFMIGSFCHYLYLPPAYAVAQGLAGPRLRATAIALLLFLGNLIGYGMGPPAVGALSDLLRESVLAASGATTAACAQASEALAATCADASVFGLRYALIAAFLGYLWAGLHLLAARRTLRDDWVG